MNAATGIGAALLSLVLVAPVAAQGDADAGEKVFRRCKACHQVGEGARNGVGPELNGVLGRPAASVDGFRYSEAFREKGEEGLVWDEESLTVYLTKPKNFIPGTKMSFAGLSKEQDVADVLAYLAQFQ